MPIYPQVSVICTCYNHENYVLDALNSIINQSYPNIQLIITDDFSKDNSVSVINEWLEANQNIIFIKNSKNKGSTKTFNKAFEYVTGEYIIDLAADDILLENCIEEQIKAFESSKYENLAIVYANIDLIDENKNFISTYYQTDEFPESGDIYKMIIGRTTKICSVAAMIKKNIFESVGQYDENLVYEDLDFWTRVSRNYSFQYIPLVLAKKRELPNSLTANYFYKKSKLTHKLHCSTLKIYEKMLNLNTSKDEYRIMLNRVYSEMFVLLKAREFVLLIKLFTIGFKAFIKSI